MATLLALYRPLKQRRCSFFRNKLRGVFFHVGYLLLELILLVPTVLVNFTSLLSMLIKNCLRAVVNIYNCLFFFLLGKESVEYVWFLNCCISESFLGSSFPKNLRDYNVNCMHSIDLWQVRFG